MKDDDLDARLDALLRDAARTYHRPPDFPETESLWAAIDQVLPAEQAAQIVAGMERPRLTVVHDAPAPRRRLLANPWLRTAAVLLLGVAIGRVSTRVPVRAAERPSVAAATESVRPSPKDGDLADIDRVATTEYLGRTEALLAQLPAELQARRADPAYQSQADALLLKTRLLMDSPAAADPALRSLFDDLELVLAQVVRLQNDSTSHTELDLIRRALQQRDVIPRLRTAVADISAN